MPRLLQRHLETPRPCTYLPGRSASLDHRWMVGVSPADLEALLSRGWRRFGPTYFRPACEGCGECVSLRIPIAPFAPTESQLRALRRCRRFRIEVGPPRVDAERLALYRLWHRERESSRAWEPSPLNEADYREQFAFPHPAAHEVAFYSGDALVALGLWDVTPQSWSAVYFFYHPSIARLSPGVGNVMVGLECARAEGKQQVYLGFRVLGCPSLRYKEGFGPHQLLRGRPGFDEEPSWDPG